MRTVRALLIVLAALGQPCAFAAEPYAAPRHDPTQCAPDRAEYPAQTGASLELEYRIRTFGRSGIRNFTQPGSNAPIFIGGDDTLVVLIHGFMASPQEMLPLGKAIHASLGTSVYMPLIRGFGSGAEIARSYRLEDWRAGIADSIAWGEHCYTRVFLVGYSVGGGLVAGHVLESEPHGVSGQVLLSPFFKGAPWQQTWAGATASKGFLGILTTLFRVKKISLSTIDRVSRGNYHDLTSLLQDPDTYDQSFALRAGMNMLDLTRLLKSVPNRMTVDIPTSVAISESDQTISHRYALKFVNRHFPNLGGTLVLERNEQIPHQIVVPDDDLNPAFGRVSDWVVQQLKTMMETR
jgi:alpha-beta hydrolase superfamily lysophospholipase